MRKSVLDDILNPSNDAFRKSKFVHCGGLCGFKKTKHLFIKKKLLEKNINYSKWIKAIPNFDKEIKNYVDYWIGKNNNIEFNFDLLNDLILHLDRIAK